MYNLNKPLSVKERITLAKERINQKKKIVNSILNKPKRK